MKDSMVNSTNEKAPQNSSLKRLKTFTDLSQTPETTALSGEAESAGSISAINPIDLLAITTHVQAASSLPMKPPPEIKGPGNEATTTQNDALALDGTQSSTPFAAHLEEKIKPKLEQWREYNRINKNKIPNEAIITHSEIDTLVETVTEALTLFPGHPALLDIAQIANRLAVVTETEWKSVQTVAMNDTLTALKKIINALMHTAKSLQDTRNDTMAYWDEYQLEQLQILKNSSAALILEHQFGTLSNVNSARSKAVDDLVEKSFENSTDEFKTKLNTLLFEKVKQHKAVRIDTLAEASKRATKASQKAFNSSLNKMPTLKENSQSSRETQHILPNLFFESGRVLKNAAADFDKAQHALKKPRNTSYKIIKTTYTVGKKTGALLKSSAQSINTKNILDFTQRVEKANSDVDDFVNTTLPSLAKRGGYIIQRLALSSKKNWEKSLAPTGQDSIDFDASLSVTPLEILAATQDLLVATTNLLAAGHAANKSAEPTENIKKQAPNNLTILDNDSSGHFKSALSEKQALHMLTQQAIDTLMTIEQEALTKTARKFNDKKEVANKKAFKLEEAKTAALEVAPRVQTLASDEAFQASIEATLDDIDPRFKQNAERKLLSLSNTIKPAANALFEAATDLVNTATLHTETQAEMELMIANVKNVEHKIRNIKAKIELALTQMIGYALHNYSHRGLLAKDIGQFIASEKAAYLKDNPGAESEVDLAIMHMLNTLKSDLTTPKDHQGKVLDKWVKMAVKDAENDAISWPASLEDTLSQYPKIKDYLQEWGAKKFNYNLLLGIISTSLQDSARTLERLASVHPQKKLLRPRMGYLKVLLMPFTIPLAIHGLRQAARVGENPQSAVKKFLKREAGKLAFRLLTLVLPSAGITALAGGLTFMGLYKGGKYNEEYLEKAKKRMAFNLLSAGIEQPFMLTKTRRITEAQRYFSSFKKIPDFSNISVTDGPETYELVSDIVVTSEYPDSQSLTTDVYKDSSAPSYLTKHQKPFSSLQKIPERLNTPSPVVQDEVDHESNLAPSHESSPSQSVSTEFKSDYISSSVAATERSSRNKRSVNPPNYMDTWTEEEDTKTVNNSVTKTTSFPITETQPRDPNKDKLTVLMRYIAKAKHKLSVLKKEDTASSVIYEKQKELDDKEKELELLYKRLPEKLVTETTRQFITSEIYARNMLEEMKTYYPKAVGSIWNDFDPDQEISFSFYALDPSNPGKRITYRGKATLADFLNGNVRRVMTTLNRTSGIIFEGSHARTEVVQDLNLDSRGYTPGLWSKTKALNNLVTPEDRTKGITRPSTTDIVTVKVYTDSTTVKYVKISLDDYIRRRYLTESEKSSGLNKNPEVTWPTHHTESWKKTINTQAFHEHYLRGDTAIKASALSRPTIDNSIKLLTTKLWDDENFKTRINAHPQLKVMNPDSIITFVEYRFGIQKKTSMSFLDFITEGRQRIKNSDTTIIIDPPGLALNDPLLNEMIETTVTARIVVAHLYEVEDAAKRINISHPINILQEELDNAVVEQQTGNYKFKHLKLTDKVTVNYIGTWIYEPTNIAGNIITLLSKTGLISEKIKETKEFTILEIMQGKHIRHAIGKSYEKIVVDPDSEYDRAVMSKLSKTDWQEHLHAKYQAQKDDPELIKKWNTVIIPFLSQHNKTDSSDKPFHTVLFNRKYMSSVYAVSKKNGGFELRSLHDGTHFEFRDEVHMVTAFNKGYSSSTSSPALITSQSLQPGQKDEEFYSWLTAHMSEDQKNAAAEKSALPYLPSISMPAATGMPPAGQNAEDFAGNLFTLLFEQLMDDTDTLIKSDAELLGHLFFQGLTDAGPYLAGGTSFLSGALGYGTGLVLASAPFAELLISDSAQESREIFWMALINAAIDYKLDFAVKPNIKRFIKSGIPFLTNSFQAIKKTAKLFDPSTLKTTKIEPWSNMVQDLILVGKTKYKTAKLLSTTFSTPHFDKDMNLIQINNKGDTFSTALTIAHAGTIYNSPFIAAKGDLVVFIATPKESLENDENEIKHVMICVGDGLFSGVANDVLDPTLSSEKQIFTTEELIKLGERGMHNTEDVSNNTPLTIRVLRPEDEEVEPEKPSMIHIPDKKYDGKFGDRALWANGIAFEQLGTQQGLNRLTIKNSAKESIIVSCIRSGTGTRWRMEWSSELLDTSETPVIESDTLDDILPEFNTLLDKYTIKCEDNLFSYQVIIGDQFEESGFMKASITNSIAFDRSPHSLDTPLPDTNGYWDKTLADISKEQFNNAFRNYVNDQKIAGSFNASDFFNFLTSLHQGDNPDGRPENLSSIEDVRDNYSKLISSRTIAGLLNQLLLSAGYRPPEGTEGSPFSKQSLSAFLGMLVNIIPSENNFELEHDNLSAKSFNAEYISEDMNDMTLNQGFSGVFSGWLLPILYKNKKMF